ncbi:helix-turn-helix domain-containing protein [Clostridium saccharobutylicum]|uniref:HTH-type transcriptional regulator SinR n=1 Tax=Clostridium saccharobutylicum TaxID=169679 RepID=A0A1S8NJY8_CLOSA|nr:helix-turn-helix transcriptional regulator [Clostridium saccharobutylicum]OOM16747.1 HTH-type transcriptional regulator SinR [Clostridium saccharobutylicum]
MELAAQRIGKRIQQVRKEKGFTQSELGRKIGKSESTIRKYEAGAVEPSFKILSDISRTLDVDISFFLSIEEIIPKLTETKRDMERKSKMATYAIDKVKQFFNNLEYGNGMYTGTDTEIIENYLNSLYKDRSSLDILKELIISEGYEIENIDNEILNGILKRVSSVIEIELHNLDR